MLSKLGISEYIFAYFIIIFKETFRYIFNMLSKLGTIFFNVGIYFYCSKY